MDISIQNEVTNIDWKRVAEILKEVGMAYHPAEIHERAFKKSHSVVFIFDGEQMIGFGRALSDGEYQSAIYDVAVLPEYQGGGIGRIILQNLMKQSPGCNFILYASPGKEKFYEKENFRKMKTGMAFFVNAERMIEKGFTE